MKNIIAATPLQYLLIAFVAITLAFFHTVSAQSMLPNMIMFPKITFANLEGREYKLPQDFEGKVNIVFIAFLQQQQYEVDTWIPATKKLLAETPALRYYELPTLSSGIKWMSFMIDRWMRDGISDKAAREATITLYTDKSRFRQALALPNEDSIYILLVKPDGSVVWRGEGAYSPTKFAALVQAVKAAM
jgi:hypothetical protein